MSFKSFEIEFSLCSCHLHSSTVGYANLFQLYTLVLLAIDVVFFFNISSVAPDKEIKKKRVVH